MPSKFNVALGAAAAFSFSAEALAFVNTDLSAVKTAPEVKGVSGKVWKRVELPGAVCGNGSQYKFYVRVNPASKDLVVNFEGGGACWDYESCSGKWGIRGAANINGIPDDYMNLKQATASFSTPFISPINPLQAVETQSWNIVFFPYCTGDLFVGNKTVQYQDESGKNPDLLWHHAGKKNMDLSIAWLKRYFTKPEKMLVTGCSAGGTGSLVNYHFLRDGLKPNRGYLLDDSGPIFPATAGDNSFPLHTKIRQSWNLDPLIRELKADFPKLNENDLGSVNEALATHYPNDRLSITFFQMDYNYSLYSYERFFTPRPQRNDIHRMWQQDAKKLRALLDKYPNFAYYLPYFRKLNESHCASIVSFKDSDIQAQDMDLGKFVKDLLDDEAPLKSYVEDVNYDDFTKPSIQWDLLNKALSSH